MQTPPIIAKKIEMLNYEIKHGLKSTEVKPVDVSDDLTQQSINVSSNTAELKKLLEQRLSNNPDKNRIINDLTKEMEEAAAKSTQRLQEVQAELTKKIETAAAETAKKMASEVAKIFPVPVKEPALPMKLAKTFKKLKEEVEVKILMAKTSIEIDNNKALINAIKKA